MIEESRNQFEIWCEEAGSLPQGTLNQYRTVDGYCHTHYHLMWHAWIASRESLEIEVPPLQDEASSEDYYQGRMDGRSEERDIWLNSLKVKGVRFKEVSWAIS